MTILHFRKQKDTRVGAFFAWYDVFVHFVGVYQKARAALSGRD